MQSIESDDCSLYVNRIKQLFDHGDFIGGRGYLRLGDNGCFLVEKCRKEVHLSPVFSAGPLDGFAVHCHGVADSHDGFKPTRDGRVYGLSVERLEKAADGRFAGSFIEIGSRFFPAPQSFEYFLGAGFSPLGYGVEALGSTDDGADGDGKKGQSVVTDAPRHAGVRDGEQGFVQQIGVVFRQLHGGEPWSERCLEGRVGELPEGVLSKGSDKDGFDAAVMSVELVVLGEASGVPEKDPTSGSIACAPIPIRINKGFGDPDGMPVGTLPVIGKPPDVEGKDARGQMRYAHTGEDEKAAIINQQRKSLQLERGRPPDPFISDTTFQRWTGPSQQCQPAVLINRHIAQGLSDHPLESEIMMPLHHPVPTCLLSCANETDFNAFHHVPGKQPYLSVMKFHAPLIDHSASDVQKKVDMPLIPRGCGQL